MNQSFYETAASSQNEPEFPGTNRDLVTLFVDDDAQAQRMFLRVTRKLEPGPIHLASDADEALGVVERHRVHMAIVDIHLGPLGPDGIELARRLRAAGFSGLVVMHTGDRSRQQLVRAAAAGADDFIIKADDEPFARSLEHVLERRRGPRPDAALHDLAYLRQFGITDWDLRILRALLPDFPSQKEMAARLDLAPHQIHGAFSRIRRRMDLPSAGALHRMVSMCAVISARTES